jgi:hypothetical protein
VALGYLAKLTPLVAGGLLAGAYPQVQGNALWLARFGHQGAGPQVAGVTLRQQRDENGSLI